MYKKTSTFIDFNGVERTVDLYFNLSKTELAEMELTTTGGLGDYLNKIIASQDTVAIMKMFKDLILKSYGERDPDGIHFHKSPEISKAFTETPAYDQLFMELLDAEKASEFVKGIIPKDIADEADKAEKAKIKAVKG